MDGPIFGTGARTQRTDAMGIKYAQVLKHRGGGSRPQASVLTWASRVSEMALLCPRTYERAQGRCERGGWGEILDQVGKGR